MPSLNLSAYLIYKINKKNFGHSFFFLKKHLTFAPLKKIQTMKQNNKIYFIYYYHFSNRAR